jgi:DNA-binding Lrp family transcriptional regulator
MPAAFVLGVVESGSEDEIIKELKSINNVKEAYIAYGIYDFIARVDAETDKDLKDTITNKLRGMRRIRSTQTLILE